MCEGLMMMETGSLGEEFQGLNELISGLERWT